MEQNEHFEKVSMKSRRLNHQCTSGLDIFTSDHDDHAMSRVKRQRAGHDGHAMPRVKRQRTDSPPRENTTIDIDSVPVDVLRNILSRLPTRKVGEFQKVCKDWKELTSMKHFLDMHTKHWYINQYAREVIIWKNITSRYYLNHSPSATKPYLTTDEKRILIGCNATPLFSALGFVVCKEGQNCTLILNPVTREKVKLISHKDDARLEGQVYAIFEHPRIQEICLLWGQKHPSSPETTEFQLLTMKTGNFEWRSIIPKLHKCTLRCGFEPPVVHNHVLYWMIEPKEDICCEEAILGFDVQTEEFQRLPHPGQRCEDMFKGRRHGRMHLVSIKGKSGISLIEFCTTGPYMNIWEWEKCSVKWVMKHRIMVPRSLTRLDGTPRNYKVYGMMDEESVLLGGMMDLYGSFYVLNLKKASVEPVQGDKIQGFVCAHTPTFATMTKDGGQVVAVTVPSQDVYV